MIFVPDPLVHFETLDHANILVLTTKPNIRVTMNLRSIYLIAICFLASSCKSCVHSLYGTNSNTYLNINIDSQKINNAFIQFYIDSVLNKAAKIPDSIKSLFYINNVQNDLHVNDRLVHFREYPEEWYLVAFDATPCWIKTVYNKNLNADPVDDVKQLNKDDIERIKNRFKTSVLNMAEQYAKDNSIPDSGVYLK